LITFAQRNNAMNTSQNVMFQNTADESCHHGSSYYGSHKKFNFVLCFVTFCNTESKCEKFTGEAGHEKLLPVGQIWNYFTNKDN